MAKIFISYSRQDVSLARELTTYLKQAGHDVLIDEDVLATGEPWKVTLLNTIKNSDILIGLVSGATLSSQSFWLDIGAAKAFNKTIIPVLIGNTSIPSAISDLRSIRLGADPMQIIPFVNSFLSI